MVWQINFLVDQRRIKELKCCLATIGKFKKHKRPNLERMNLVMITVNQRTNKNTMTGHITNS
jgi:hypothetical protein